jgi:DNA-binding protein WhiA
MDFATICGKKNFRRTKMSFSTEIKNEISVFPKNSCCKSALLSAIIHTAGSLNFSSEGMQLTIVSENKNVLQLVASLSQSFGVFSLKKTHEIVLSGERLLQLLIELRILKVSEILQVEEGINPYIIQDDCCKKSYFVGAFLGSGYLTVSSGYHFEISSISRKLIEGLSAILELIEISSAISERKDKHFLYVKGKDIICDILAYMEAFKAALSLNSMVAERSLKQDAARRANCDMANLDKMIAASMAQRDAILKIKHLDNEKLLAVANARLEYPEHTYDELAELLGISKSTVAYRLKRLEEISLQQNNIEE